MTVANLIDAAKRLSPSERAELLEALMLIEAPAGGNLALTPPQRADLERRIEEFESGKARMSPGPEAFARLRERRR